jgi:beta-glucanase (GH16 family)
MKVTLRVFLLITGMIAPVIGVSAGEWQLVWSDEFNHQGLPDKTKWDYEVGFVRNHESQYYTRERQENARVENGNLVIECKKEHLQPEQGKSVEYTSASLTSRTNWLYGRIEMRAKLPEGKGVWPAFWTLGTNRTQVGWPGCGEMDIMEFVGKDANHIHGTVHYAVDGKHHSNTGKLETARPFDDFHIYAVEWYSDRIDFYFDNQKYHTVQINDAGKGGNNPFRKPHYLIVNLALGGSWGGPFDDAMLPKQYLIDYIRIYKQRPLLRRIADWFGRLF